MTIAQRQPMTLEQFLDWEERQERPFEFDGLRAIAMTGVTVAQDRITFNLQKALDTRLSGKACRPFGPNVKIIVTGRARYPDAIVSYEPAAPGGTVVSDPVVVFEVISDDTARTDRIEKLREYQATPSIRRYIILEQKSIGAMMFAREGDIWSVVALTEGDIVGMPEIGTDIPLAELYAGLDLAPIELHGDG